MNCAGCDRTLLRREHAQPMQVMGIRTWPKSFCDTCCRANPWPTGNPAALERLITGKTDYHELARITQATPTTTTEATA